ncbi:hypothetical protein [Methanolapillus millepedarum]|uniref:Uncharacterized protein n=1 Tax=Methanolapillus millepedarum TaxID=3028296 RepID=A0AA96ZWP1_9EURY|nr:hypothetical protein MsAc7_17850 [Methanosarcinaceae archaeon Ac7]
MDQQFEFKIDGIRFKKGMNLPHLYAVLELEPLLDFMAGDYFQDDRDFIQVYPPTAIRGAFEMCKFEGETKQYFEEILFADPENPYTIGRDITESEYFDMLEEWGIFEKNIKKAVINQLKCRINGACEMLLDNIGVLILKELELDGMKCEMYGAEYDVDVEIIEAPKLRIRFNRSPRRLNTIDS